MWSFNQFEIKNVAQDGNITGSPKDGFLKLGTPICIASERFVALGQVVSINTNRKPMDIERKGSEVCIKIEFIGSETPKRHGLHFDRDDNQLILSKIIFLMI